MELICDNCGNKIKGNWRYDEVEPGTIEIVKRISDCETETINIFCSEECYKDDRKL